MGRAVCWGERAWVQLTCFWDVGLVMDGGFVEGAALCWWDLRMQREYCQLGLFR